VTIRKGADWGTTALPPAGLRCVDSDAKLRQMVIDSRNQAIAIPNVGLLGGDLMRTVGGSGSMARFESDEPVTHLPIDVVRVVADETNTSWFVAHCVARRSWWRESVTAAMNAEFLGRWDVAPRGHPNDGKVDVVTVSPEMTIQQRLMARKRLPLGTHLPHPLVSVTSTATTIIHFGRPTQIWLDGCKWKFAQQLELVVEPDALIVCI
jgi:hypothetical protein